jgi:hypothetical protein
MSIKMENDAKISKLLEEKGKITDLLNKCFKQIDRCLYDSRNKKSISTKSLKKMYELKSLLCKVDFNTYIKHLNINCEFKLRMIIRRYLEDRLLERDIEFAEKYNEKLIVDNKNILSIIKNATYKSGNFNENEISILKAIADTKVLKKN